MTNYYESFTILYCSGGESKWYHTISEMFGLYNNTTKGIEVTHSYRGISLLNVVGNTATGIARRRLQSLGQRLPNSLLLRTPFQI